MEWYAEERHGQGRGAAVPGAVFPAERRTLSSLSGDACLVEWVTREK